MILSFLFLCENTWKHLETPGNTWKRLETPRNTSKTQTNANINKQTGCESCDSGAAAKEPEAQNPAPNHGFTGLITVEQYQSLDRAFAQRRLEAELTELQLKLQQRQGLQDPDERDKKKIKELEKKIAKTRKQLYKRRQATVRQHNYSKKVKQGHQPQKQLIEDRDATFCEDLHALVGKDGAAHDRRRNEKLYTNQSTRALHAKMTEKGHKVSYGALHNRVTNTKESDIKDYQEPYKDIAIKKIKNSEYKRHNGIDYVRNVCGMADSVHNMVGNDDFLELCIDDKAKIVAGRDAVKTKGLCVFRLCLFLRLFRFCLCLFVCLFRFCLCLFVC